MLTIEDLQNITLNTDTSNTKIISSDREEIMKEIFKESEYKNFKESISYLIERAKLFDNSDSNINSDNPLSSDRYGASSLLSADRSNNLKKSISDEIKYDKLNDTASDVSTSKNNVTLDTQDDDEKKIMLHIKSLISKFDSCGDSLNSIEKIYSYRDPNFGDKHDIFINSFFSNMLIFGSYKLKSNIAHSKEIAYKAASVSLIFLLIRKK